MSHSKDRKYQKIRRLCQREIKEVKMRESFDATVIYEPETITSLNSVS